MNAFFVTLSLLIVTAHATSQKDSPIIGIVTSPLAQSECIQVTASTPLGAGVTSCLVKLYVQWLEQAALRVVPIPFDANTTVLDSLYASVNGILFTGGEIDLGPNVPYYQTAQYLFNKASAGNKQGDYMPVWGTCQGFQLLGALAANDASLITCDLTGVDGVMLPLVMTPQAPSSVMFGVPSLGKDVLKLLTLSPTTLNFHKCRISPQAFVDGPPSLRETFKTLSTNTDTLGLPFVSTMEGITLPFYATQWHPERPQFEFEPAVVNSPEATRVSQHFANFIMSQARKSSHAFPSEAAAEAALIYNYSPVYSGKAGVFNYFFF